MELKKLSKYKVKDIVKFFYFYEDKIGEISEITSDKYVILQKSNKIYYTVGIDKIEGKVIENDK